MITLKDNKLPKIYLKCNKYKIKSDNEYVREYRKTIISKDEWNYGCYYYIHIFYHKKDKDTEVCVSTKFYSQPVEDWRYNWFVGEDEDDSIYFIGKFDNKLLKYLEVIDE